MERSEKFEPLKNVTSVVPSVKIKDMSSRSSSPTDWLMSFNNLAEQLSPQEIDPIPDFMIDAVYQEPTSVTNQLVGNSMDPELLPAPIPSYVSNSSAKLPFWFEDECNSHPEFPKLLIDKESTRDNMSLHLQKRGDISQNYDDFQSDLNSTVDLEEPQELLTPIPEISEIFPCIRQLKHNDPMLMLPEVSATTTTANLNETTANQVTHKSEKKHEENKGCKDSRNQNAPCSTNVYEAFIPLQKLVSASEQENLTQGLKINLLPEQRARSDEQSRAQKEIACRKKILKDSDVGNEDKVSNDNQKIFTNANQSATPKSKSALVCFYKNEFLAVRNTHGGFYICKARQNVYQSTKKINIKWLIEESSGIYVLDYDDTTELNCVLTNLNLVKITRDKYRLPFYEFRRAINILRRSIDVENGVIDRSQLDVTEDNPDGLDLSVYHNEEQLIKNRRGSLYNNNYPKSPNSPSKSNMMVSKSRTVSHVTSPKPTSSKITPNAELSGKASKKQPGLSIKRKSMGIANESSSLSTVTQSPEKKSKNRLSAC